ncbi:MAG: transglutaminase domain-containing protein [Deltaproteobacteria bacterium]|nr:transglutaminase domain-containing protein [Deltaproteobacteria bacterium]
MSGRASQRRTWIAVGAGLALVGAAVVTVAVAQPSGGGERPVLHERVEGLADFRWDPVDPAAAALARPGSLASPAGDLGVGPVGSSSGGLPPGELLPDVPLPPRPDAPVSDIPPAQFHPDLDTDSAEIPDDPNLPGILWSPSPGPYLRQQVFDTVLADGTLDAPASRPDDLRTVAPPDGAAGTERFLGRARLWVNDDSAVQLPSPAPDFRAAIVGGAAEGDRLAVDRAGNLFFLPGPARGERELVISLEADSLAFGGTFDATATVGDAPSWARRQVPETFRAPARRVADRVAVSADMPVETALRLLSTWFRSFQAGPPPSSLPGTAYEELALGRVGLCRHRAYAFVVTAQWLGIPARMPVSRLHAWVEVLVPVPGDGGPRWLWRRIDLGGAYGETDEELADVPAHVPSLADPLPWPRGAQPTPTVATPGATPAAPGTTPGGPPPGAGATPDPGAASATAPGAPPAPAPGSPVSPPGTPPGSPAGPTATPPAGPSLPPEPNGHVAHSSDRPPSPAESSSAPDTGPASSALPPSAPVAFIDRYPYDALRGDSVEVSGRVSADASAAPVVRLVLVTASGAERDVGTLAVSPSGAFSGTLTIPPDATPGDYVLRADASP